MFQGLNEAMYRKGQIFAGTRIWNASQHRKHKQEKIKWTTNQCLQVFIYVHCVTVALIQCLPSGPYMEATRSTLQVRRQNTQVSSKSWTYWDQDESWVLPDLSKSCAFSITFLWFLMIRFKKKERATSRDISDFFDSIRSSKKSGWRS